MVHRRISRSVPALSRVTESVLPEDSVGSKTSASIPRACPLRVCSFSPEAASQTMMLVSADAEISSSFPCSVHARTALTKSVCP
jgi:hypothetical protein